MKLSLPLSALNSICICALHAQQCAGPLATYTPIVVCMHVCWRLTEMLTGPARTSEIEHRLRMRYVFHYNTIQCMRHLYVFGAIHFSSYTNLHRYKRLHAERYDTHCVCDVM